MGRILTGLKFTVITVRMITYINDVYGNKTLKALPLWRWGFYLDEVASEMSRACRMPLM